MSDTPVFDLTVEEIDLHPEITLEEYQALVDDPELNRQLLSLSAVRYDKRYATEEEDID